MALYTINVDAVNVIYDLAGNQKEALYDIYGNIVMQTGQGQSDPYIEGRTLLFEDNFAGDALDEAIWDYEIGYVRNNELQFYKQDNVAVENGNLVITAKRETWKGFEWTSGSIHTNNKLEQQYGRFEAKIKFPGIIGSFPAFWMVGANLELEYHDDGSDNGLLGDVGWPECGEIDIVEMIPGNATSAQANLWKYSGGSFGGGRSSTIDAKEWHIYACEWTDEYIAMFVDGTEYKRYTFSNYSDSDVQAYKLPFYMTLNLAVGASGGTPEGTTNEMKMYVDWVRVYVPI